jgi:hypothetical protein
MPIKASFIMLLIGDPEKPGYTILSHRIYSKKFLNY